MKFRSLKMLADENVSPRVLSFLREKGIDVADVKERKWHGKEDQYLLERALCGNEGIKYCVPGICPVTS